MIVSPLKVWYVVVDRSELFHKLFDRIASIQSDVDGQTDAVVSMDREFDLDAVGGILDDLGLDVHAFCEDMPATFEEFPGRVPTLELLRACARTWAGQHRHAHVANDGDECKSMKSRFRSSHTSSLNHDLLITN